jgi:hypothetical protein
LETDMTAAIARLLPRASATSLANIDTFVTVALFSGAGLLVALRVDPRSKHARRMVLKAKPAA